MCNNNQRFYYTPLASLGLITHRQMIFWFILHRAEKGIFSISIQYYEILNYCKICIFLEQLNFVIILTLNLSLTSRFVQAVFTKLNIGCAKLILCVMFPLVEGSGDTAILKKRKKEQTPIFYFSFPVLFINLQLKRLQSVEIQNMKSIR